MDADPSNSRPAAAQELIDQAPAPEQSQMHVFRYFQALIYLAQNR